MFELHVLSIICIEKDVYQILTLKTSFAFILVPHDMNTAIKQLKTFDVKLSEVKDKIDL